MALQRSIAIAVILVGICWTQTTTSTDVPITTTRNVLQYHTLHIETDSTVVFTWEAKRGTSNITLRHADDVNVIMQEHNTREFKITVTVVKEITSAVKPLHSSSPLALLIVTLALAFVTSRYGCRQWCFFISLYLITIYGFAETTTTSSVRLVVPSDSIQRICINGQCSPVVCKLSLNSDYSNVPSNSPIFQHGNCTIKKPDRWDEWLAHYFGNESVQQTYFGDFDQDGLVNILEYYGLGAFGNRPYGETENQTENGNATEPETRSKREILPIGVIGSDPTKPDSDGDLLTDGFEVYNSLNPRRRDETEGDYDGDSLSNLQEQIRQLDPLNPDSDGDGIPDGEEVEMGGDPRNPADEGQEKPGEQTALVRLTVGDHSGSHSERYILHVGHISHQSPGFGLVGSGEYKFHPGTYRITLQHAGTNRETPDYDYTAIVQKVRGEARVRVEDPQRMLGRHHESRYFYAQGKSASLIVEANCTGEDCKCTNLKTCDQCVTNPDPKCEWDVDEATCVDQSVFNWFGYATDISECPCKKCKDWYDGEKAENSNWRNDVNRLLPCPCQARVGVFGLNPVGVPAADGTWT